MEITSKSTELLSGILFSTSVISIGNNGPPKSPLSLKPLYAGGL